MFTAAQIEILEAFDIPYKYLNVPGDGFLNVADLASKINKREKLSRRKKEKLSKAERIEFYALQVACNEPIEFQPDYDRLYVSQLKFVEGYCNITGESMD